MPENCDVICASYYDENAGKPFHMMTNVVEGVEVIEIQRKCFNTTTMKHFYVTIMRLSLADLKFQEQVATVWCLSPMIILDEKQASAATAYTSPQIASRKQPRRTR
uniref:Uncharacterized protein n=1 Tax=Haptolina ericina TaxID=156174 RepID=A0A6T9DHZ4_9EUKA|mmetsp:Transcript_27367/g.61879  ORF Transcript_27367/g.61879 Transcript_27367/m.61879 type:complete len:106 (+) Transcript_27367:277-594(+)